MQRVWPAFDLILTVQDKKKGGGGGGGGEEEDETRSCKTTTGMSADYFISISPLF